MKERGALIIFAFDSFLTAIVTHKGASADSGHYVRSFSASSVILDLRLTFGLLRFSQIGWGSFRLPFLAFPLRSTRLARSPTDSFLLQTTVKKETVPPPTTGAFAQSSTPLTGPAADEEWYKCVEVFLFSLHPTRPRSKPQTDTSLLSSRPFLSQVRRRKSLYRFKGQDRFFGRRRRGFGGVHFALQVSSSRPFFASLSLSYPFFLPFCLLRS